MKRPTLTKFSVVIACLMSAYSLTATAGGTALTMSTAIPGGDETDQIIVRLKSQAGQPGIPASVLQRLNNTGKANIAVERAMSGGGHVLKLDGRKKINEINAIIQRLKQDPDVEIVQPDYIQHAATVPNDTFYGSQWHYFDPVGGIGLPNAWDMTTGSSSVVVAVVDTGYRPHVDLVANIVGGYDFIADTFVANDGNGRDSDAKDPGDWSAAGACYSGSPSSNSSWHGTHVAGTIGAVSNNAKGVAGINWNVKILPIRVLGRCGGYTSDIIDGVVWAAGLPVAGVPANPYPAKVINMSLGGAHICSPAEQMAIDAAVAAGAVIVVAAGNSNADASNYSPASCNNVMTVAASNKAGNRSYYSNYGNVVELAAPGGDYSVDSMILSTLNSGTSTPGSDSYAAYQGTSMAAPHVAGVAALLLAASPSLTPAQIMSTLQTTVRPFPPGSTCNTSLCGTGILDANAAVSTVFTPDTTPDSFSFGDLTGTALNTVLTSNTITVSGLNMVAGISVSGCTSTQCEYNINNSTTWLTAPSTVKNGNTVKVRQKSSASQSTATNLILTIGTLSDTFSVTTGAVGNLEFAAPAYTVAESGLTATLTVNRTGGSMGAASVKYATSNGNATAGQDYTAKTGTLSWADGDANPKNIPVTITNDTFVESDETFTVTLSAPTGAALGATTASTVTITDNDGNIQFDAATASVNEGAGTVTLNVTRTGTLTAAASVKYATAAGTASAADFTASSGTLNWGAGDGSTQTIIVPIVNDALVEGLEAFTVTLSTPVGATLGSVSKSTITIADNDSAIQLAATIATVNESNGSVTLNVTRTAGAGAIVDAASVDYLTANGTALAGSDYTASNGAVSWSAGELGTKTITIPVTDDTLVEANETFGITLSNPVNAILGTAKTATVTLTDNDSNLQFSAPTYGVSEGLATLTLTVTRTGTLTSAASVDYASADDTATAGSDYTVASGTLNWAAGNGAAKTIVIPIAADALVEGNETFTVSLSNPTGGTLGANAATTGTITDNDSLLQFSAPSFIVNESGVNAVITVGRVGSPALASSVSYTTADGTATAGSDYAAKAGTLSWAANDAATKTITIPVTNDTITEGNETFTVTLTNPVNAILGATTASTVTIVDNEAAPAGGIQFSASKFTVKEDDGTAVLTVSRSGDTSAAATVNYATTAGSATTTDFTAKTGSVTWAAGDGADKTIVIPLTNDTVAEAAEAFTVTLSNVAGSTLGAQATATVWIADGDDSFPRYGMMPVGLVKPAAAASGWQVSSEQTMTGSIYSMRSNTIGDGQTAAVELTGNFLAGNVGFALKTSSEAIFDALVFYVDGVEQGRWSGIQTVWTTVTYPLTAGAHTLTWAYEKDGSGTNGADGAWVDSVVFPTIAP